MMSKLIEFTPRHQALLREGHKNGMLFALVAHDATPNVKYVAAMSQSADMLRPDFYRLEHIPSMQGIFDDGINVMIRCLVKNSLAYLVSTDKDIFLFSGDAHAAAKMPEGVAIQKMVQLSTRDEISKLEMVRA